MGLDRAPVEFQKLGFLRPPSARWWKGWFDVIMIYEAARLQSLDINRVDWFSLRSNRFYSAFQLKSDFSIHPISKTGFIQNWQHLWVWCSQVPQPTLRSTYFQGVVVLVLRFTALMVILSCHEKGFSVPLLYAVWPMFAAIYLTNSFYQ